jgi:hypothetical protein
MPDRAVAVELTIAAPFSAVWNALRDPDEIRRWHGWEYDGLDDEIATIYLQDVEVDEAAGTIAIADGSRFELEDRGATTVVRVTMPGPAAGASWDEFYDDIREGWTTFVEQLRFGLERHPGEERRTLMLAGAPRLAPDHGGREVFGSAHQIGYAVDDYGPGLVVLHAKPDGGGLAVVTTYGLDDEAFAALERRWRDGYAR